MAVADRVQTLRSKHENLDRVLHMEACRPMPDAMTMAQLKKEKLRVKEEIERLVH